jgi:amino acid transporter
MKETASSANGDNHPKPDASTGTLGTFAGVFTPSILTILGIILFLRLGYVIGQAGLARALIIIGVANLISILTSISLSAIATNIKVKGGGDYYLISRTLGVEFGGSIGIVLFLAQAVSIAFYCIGFGEALTGMFNNTLFFTPRMIAVFAVSFLFIFAWLGADWATRFQYVVMGLLTLALFSFFYGGIPKWDSAMVVKNWTAPSGGPGFWVIFAIFFPAVTGFTQGVSMSGDLKDPGKSLPLGTFIAVGLSLVVYFGVTIIFAGVLSGDVMVSDYTAMKRVSRFNILIDAGVVAATLSSAMASFLGAPRILQSLASDRIFPFLLPFAQGAGPADNPRRGVLLSLFIAYVTIALGNLNVIAPIVSMFFLISYGLLNYATFYEARSGSTSFRPRFRWFDYRLSFFGWIACLVVMMAINPAAGIMAISILFAIHHYLKGTAGPARWADSRRSYHLQRIREHLFAAGKEPEHARDWRPQLLAFSNDSHRRKQLLRFASWVEGGSGFTAVVKILEGEGIQMLKKQAEAEEELRKDISALEVNSFPLAVFASDFGAGLNTLIQSFGIGPLKANTILLNWLEKHPIRIHLFQAFHYHRNLRAAFRLGCNILLLHAPEEKWTGLEGIPSEERRIDVWWRNDPTSRLALLLAFLITKNPQWEDARIRVLSEDPDGSSPDSAEENLKKTLEAVRIDAISEIVEKIGKDAVAAHSADAAMVFLPFRFQGDRIVSAFADNIDALLSGLPVTAMALASEDIDLEAEPEEGKAGEIAAATDVYADAKQKAETAEKEASHAAFEAENKRQAHLSAVESNVDQETLKTMETEANDADQLARLAFRKAAKWLAKSDQSARDLEKLGVDLSGDQTEDTDE